MFSKQRERLNSIKNPSLITINHCLVCHLTYYLKSQQVTYLVEYYCPLTVQTILSVISRIALHSRTLLKSDITNTQMHFNAIHPPERTLLGSLFLFRGCMSSLVLYLYRYLGNFSYTTVIFFIKIQESFLIRIYLRSNFLIYYSYVFQLSINPTVSQRKCAGETTNLIAKRTQ